MVQLFRDMSIKAKLLGGFLLIAILSLIIGVYGSVNMNKIAAKGNLMYSDNLRSIDQLHSINEELYAIRGDVNIIAYSKDPDAIKKAAETVEELRIVNQEYIDAYGKNNLSEEERDNWNAFLADVETYKSARQELIDAALAGQYDAALTKLPEVTTIREEMMTKLDAFIASEQEVASVGNEANQAIAATSSLVMGILIIIGIVASIGLGIGLSFSIANAVKKGLNFAAALGDGDLTVKIDTKGKDELGKLIIALNEAQTNMRQIVSGIVEQTDEVAAASEELSATLEEISGSFESINDNTSTIADGVLDIQSATQQLTATVEQVDSGVTQLATNSSEGSSQAAEIKSRAIEIKKKGGESQQSAEALFIEKQKNILDSIEKGKVVEEISNIANLINGIASQTNLLALNASIEAARAGEHGKGFAVVATEIGTLASQSTQYVSEITAVVNNVKSAFDNLANNSKQVLDYMDADVRAGFALLVDTGITYEKDAVYVSGLSQDTAAMAEELNASTEEISSVIQTIAANMDHTAASFHEIRVNMKETTEAMDHIAKTAENQAVIAETLSNLTSRFKI
ncbi:methyl-accepting chemotaxis protein [Konateibacter massiliensis]|uniref:methyl-accepting chemotaxis protein n=1 Tax=Konateibacter massiliensis TaxID=2002841 RepID=UPI0015D4B526|nr:methyl-accepting chemotaxis protein [Konateibacter massiliensis]